MNGFFAPAPLNPSVNIDCAPFTVHGGVQLLGRLRRLDRAQVLLELRVARARYAVGLATAEALRLQEKPAPPGEADALRREVEVLAAFDRFALAQRFVAAWYADAGEAERGLPYGDRAIRLDPACASCLDTIARIRFLTGARKAAVVLERRAIAAVPDGRASHRFLRHLAEYESAP